MSLHVAAYDISSESSRRRVAKVLLSFGRRIQESVYEIDLEPNELSELRRLIGPHLEPSDEFDLFPIDTRRPQSRLRWQQEPYGSPVTLV